MTKSVMYRSRDHKIQMSVTPDKNFISAPTFGWRLNLWNSRKYGSSSFLECTHSVEVRFWWRHVKTLYSLQSCFVENMAERFPAWAWMLFTWILSQCPHFAGESQMIKTAEDGVTKEWNFSALRYKQITTWFLRDIWHK